MINLPSLLPFWNGRNYFYFLLWCTLYSGLVYSVEDAMYAAAARLQFNS